MYIVDAQHYQAARILFNLLKLFTLSANLSAAAWVGGDPRPCSIMRFIISIGTFCLYDLLWGQWMVPTKPWQSLADNKNSIFHKW